MAEDANFIIKEDKYTLSIIKRNKLNNKKPSRGISIFKKTLELNELNEENINQLLKNSNKEDIKYSYANIGLISLSGLICFAYCNEKDVKEIGVICLIPIFQIRNISYIIIDPEIDISTKKQILKFFNEFTQYEINRGLIFADNLLNLDLSFDAFYHHFYDINKNIVHINPSIKFCYNDEYMAYFKKYFLEEYSTHITCGYYYENIIKNNQKNEIKIHLIIKDRELQEELKENQKEQILREIEVIFSPINLCNNQIFHFLFFSYIGDYLNKKELIFNLLKKGQPEKKINNGSVIIIDIQNKIKGKKEEEINRFIISMKNKLNKELGYNNKFIFINSKKEIKNEIERNIDILDEIKFNYELKGMDYAIEFEKKQLLIISDNEINSLIIIETILSLIKYKFLDEYEKNINTSPIYEYLQIAMKNYRDYIKIKNNNFLKLEKISSLPINEEFLNKKIFFKIIEKKEIKKEDTIEFDFGTLQNIENNKLNQNSENENINININKIIEEKKEIKIKRSNDKIFLYIATYNVGSYDFENGYNEDLLIKLLFPKDIKNYFSKNNFPTFYCIGLQEIVKLSTSNVIFQTNKNNVSLWETKITQLLQKNYNYTLQYKENLVGILFLFFVKTSEARNIIKIKKSIVKAGFLNKLGNKGYILFEFTYNNKKFSFCTGHLTAGEKYKNFTDRLNLLIDILNHKNEKDQNKFFQSDFYFLFGDMNFRVKAYNFFQKLNKIQTLNKNVFDDSVLKHKNTLTFDTFSPYIEENKREEKKRGCSVERIDYTNLLGDIGEKKNYKINNNEKPENFELLSMRKINEEQFKYNFLNEFLELEELTEVKKNLRQYDITEHEVKFLPTYKYIKGHTFYNVSQRIPSWTDRILFKNNKDIKCLYYDKIDLKLSDHRPVYALFEIEMKKHKYSL